VRDIFGQGLIIIRKYISKFKKSRSLLVFNIETEH